MDGDVLSNSMFTALEWFSRVAINQALQENDAALIVYKKVFYY